MRSLDPPTQQQLVNRQKCKQYYASPKGSEVHRRYRETIREKTARYNRNYKRTKEGRVISCYAAMKNRVEGKTNRAIYYKGLDICDRSDFIRWSLADPTFNRLFEEWETEGFSRRLVPSIDRRDTFMGYTLDNLQWLTLSNNACKAAQFRVHGIN